MYDTWQRVDLYDPWKNVAPGAMLVYTDDDAVVIDARVEDKKIKLRVQRLDGERFEKDAKLSDTIRKQVREIIPEGKTRAIALPAVLWHEDQLFSPRNLVGMLASIVVTVAILIVMSLGDNNVGAFMYWAFAAGGAAGLWARRLWKTGRITFLAPDRLGLTMETIHPYALSLEQGELWVPPTRGADRRQLAFQRVDAIRTAYLELREDIAYRIESSALFDPAVPATAAFEEALVRFGDVTDATPTPELDDHATEVELAFNTARANAERLGLEHLPEDARAEGRRAGKAARLAAGASTEGEREASLTQVRRILDSLALYYLPTLDEKLAIAPPRNH